ncbi:MAG: terpene synthase family protein [bacterium]
MDEFVARVTREAEALGLLPDDKHRARYRSFVRLAGHVYNYVPIERLLPLSQVERALYYVDDAGDDDPHVGECADRTAWLVERALARLEGSDERPRGPVERALDHVAADLRVHEPWPGWYDAFVVGFAGYCHEGLSVALDYTRRGEIPDPATYHRVRRHDSGMYLTQYLGVGFALGRPLAPAAATSPAIGALVTATIDQVALANDLLSYHKEVVRRGSRFNSVLVYAHHEDLSLPAAVDRVIGLCNDAVARIEALEAEVLASPLGREASVMAFIGAQQQWIAGHLAFATETSRYIDPLG